MAMGQHATLQAHSVRWRNVSTTGQRFTGDIRTTAPIACRFPDELGLQTLFTTQLRRPTGGHGDMSFIAASH